MNILKRAAVASANRRKQDQVLYAKVLAEIENSERIPGIWAMALAKADGDEKRATAHYIEKRVQDLRDDALIVHDVTARQEPLTHVSNVDPAAEYAQRMLEAERWADELHREAAMIDERHKASGKDWFRSLYRLVELVAFFIAIAILIQIFAD